MGDWLGNVTTPPPRDYAQETRDTLQAQVDLAPQMYAAQAQYGPQYAQLSLDTTRAVTPGLLDLYEKTIGPSLSRQAAADQTARGANEMALIRQYGPEMARILREASGNAGLLDTLTQQAQSELDLGASVDPSLANELSQGVRAAQAARGFGFGAPDAIQEAFTRGQAGINLRNQRRQFAGNVVGLNQATGGDPFLALLGRPSQAMSAMQGYGAQAQGYNPGMLFNPESGYASDVYNSNYNADAAARIAEANNATALFKSMVEGSSRVTGSLASAGIFGGI